MKTPILTRVAPDDPTLHEVIEKKGQLVMRPYFADPDGDRPLTEKQADDWLLTLEETGGVVYERGRR